MLEVQEIQSLIIKGLKQANQEYVDWTGGHGILDHGVEPLVSSVIGRNFYNHGQREFRRKEYKDGIGVTLETSFSNIAEWSKSASKSFDGTRTRADVVVYDRKGRPQGIVEVKRKFAAWNAQSDAQRIVQLLDHCGRERGGSLRWGAIAGIDEIYGRSTDASLTRKRGQKILNGVLAVCRSEGPEVKFSERLATTRIDEVNCDGKFLIGFYLFCIVAHR